ncbi:unnamed protein product [Fusarium fujikuroi]|uniref:Methyltransferase type 11 domain-containing protein n=1 Tax=Fusarium fujikuroi TaxID=5127 RepID=A0A9Q9RXP7_FUSFU|nr:unnamed protein product [Fusarium fujikuroi]
MASPKPDNAGGSPRDGVIKDNISAGSSPGESPIVAQEEADGDASDSAFGDDAESSTASISSSILEYRKFQGRTFHSERYNTEYFTPNDEQQRDSIDITHHVLTLLLAGKLTLVPLEDDIQRVLDVGTGTVTSPMNTPTLRSSEPTSLQFNPPNVKFELEDATKDWSWPENHFNLVHVRFLMGAIADWGTLFKEASRCCKPGGFVESGEINPTFYSDDGSIDKVEALQTWNRLVIESGKGFGRSFTNIENDVQLFRDAGLVDVQSFDFKVPIGGWPKDEKMRKVGQFLRASIENDLEGYTMMVWHKIMNWPEDEYQVFLMNMRKAFKDKRIHGYMRVRYLFKIWGLLRVQSDPAGLITNFGSHRLELLITSFAEEIGYSPLKTTSNDALWKAMRAHADRTDVPYEEGTHSWLMFKVGYVYPVFAMFHERFCADEKQSIPLLQTSADLMKLTFKYWDPLIANFIVTASLNFLNSNALEARDEFHTIELTKADRSWAWFLREKDGVGEVYAWFTFPKALFPDISLFLEVVPDLCIWIGLTNDVLSFYKEELAGETHNYIHNRGLRKNPSKLMRLVLKGREPYLKLLNTHLLGYIAFHKLNSRYRLWEVGLGEDATDRTVLGP